MDVIALSRELMLSQTKKNKSPPLLLTEMVIEKGKELSTRHDVNEKLVLLSLYLAHCIFSPIWKGDIQMNHHKLSSEFVKPYLDEWKISEEEQEIILNSIEAHHDKVPTKSKVAEVVKNAECFKFVTLKGSLIYLHELGLRGEPYDESVKKVLEKMEQKKALLTLPDCIEEAEKECVKIRNIFNDNI